MPFKRGDHICAITHPVTRAQGVYSAIRLYDPTITGVTCSDPASVLEELSTLDPSPGSVSKSS